ncbi:MAG: Retron-type reverse transcriptase [Candidatus Gottesmanbacteria bacterium GW2011_GWB1_44_11c]|uniref:Retron-type reverse transcriptase n=2 Tax=Candidatus Gottesmaniibacteriota TaxID=1752720 RepID=A0A0G1IE88_9BACT|nr:hypothetical protein [uncultured bacterium]KKT34102.1 MAG: Retron-type reverse transcriptase [Candidatus Gottesmanbacteria bacterium GW2011_GWB1_44_11c]KKT57118.1 MAG: Retron-type reverse transcriptase [Candidatus Gottesmanbacteria bacterium GW2011_GWA1_44_24b]
MINNLFDKTISLESLLEAWDKFKIGKRKKPDVQVFEKKLEDNLFNLHEELASKTYRHEPYKEFYIRDPKVRLIHKSSVRDRVVNHAIFKTLNEIFEPIFIPESYSSRIGKGTHRGVKSLKQHLIEIQKSHGKCFVLKCDIKKFFHSINHAVLLRIIQTKIKDSDMIWLIRLLLDSFPNRAQFERERVGCPIGNLTSQLFANIYLNELDQYITKELHIKSYLRYTDDFVIVHYDREHLTQLITTIRIFLHVKLELKLHPNKISIRKYRQGIDFLGYVALSRATVLRTKTKNRILLKIKERVSQLKEGKITEEKFMQILNSYLGVLSHVNSHKIRAEIMDYIWKNLNSSS